MFLPSNITLKLGDSGDFVAELQRRLAARDFMTSDMVTSFYDGVTANAVRQFQTTHGIRADGVAGPETLRRLNGFSDSSTDSGGSTNGSSEQESGRNLVNQRVMQLQMEDEQLREMEKLQHEIEQQAILQQQQVQQQAQQTQQQPLHADQLQQHAQQMTETKKQLPGVEPGRDQHQQRLNDANMNAQMQQQQQAFIDRPITQTFQPLEQKPEQKPEQDVGTHNRGPNLGQAPERAASAERAPDQQQQQQAGISRPREEGIQRNASPEQGQGRTALQGNERTAEAGQAAGTERAPLRITPASTQGTTPDYGRIRQQMESRLPPHVIEEVRQVGVVMLNNGVQGGRTAPEIGAPAQTPGMDMRQPAVGGGRGV